MLLRRPKTAIRGGQCYACTAGDAEAGQAPADVFKAAIASKTDTLESGDGEALASLDSVSCIFPRGRYDLSLFPAFMDMDGPNHSYKIR